MIAVQTGITNRPELLPSRAVVVNVKVKALAIELASGMDDRVERK